MKKILIVFNHPAPYKVRLFNELSNYFDLHVIFERDAASDRSKGFYFEEEYKFTTHKIKGIKLGRENFLSCGVKKHLKHNHYDLVIMNGYSQIPELNAISYLKKKKLPYVLYINGGAIKKDNFIKRAIKQKYISGASFYFSPDEESNKYLIHYGADASKIFNYPYSTVYKSEVAQAPADKAELRKKLGINFDKVFVSSGQLIKRKNYLSLVKEWQKSPGNHGLFLIGDGKQRKEIERFIKDKKLKNVKLSGFLPREEMFEYFRAADVFLFPSKEDIYGHVINEALSQGLPVISTNKVNSAIKLIKSGENGYLLDKLEGEPLQQAINDTLKLSVFSKCVAVAKENTIEKMAEEHIKMINEVLEK